MQPWHIAWATFHQVVRNGQSGGCFEAIQHVKNAQAGSCADVQSQDARWRLLEQVIQCHGMGFSEIHHVDVIANASSIVSWVVVTKNLQSFAAPCRHLRHEREQVVGNAQGVLADSAAWVGANGVEVTQAGHAPGAIAAKRLKHLLDGQLGLGVGVNRCGGHFLGQRELIRLAVHG